MTRWSSLSATAEPKHSSAAFDARLTRREQHHGITETATVLRRLLEQWRWKAHSWCVTGSRRFHAGLQTLRWTLLQGAPRRHV